MLSPANQIEHGQLPVTANGQRELSKGQREKSPHSQKLASDRAAEIVDLYFVVINYDQKHF
jgi:hypothetical protein